ncbi:SigE family RNA polymerase sigma factor [Actinokineospora enzanensis]|uniref:SigE family RNA polymerase sigma factor n=1 Tax=Actinokineospora enzanensis TaxID=155975 RepID=UPI000379D086|nr:SigE family RNA polymerase sigma factor [Actinokineospora enzanensis]
MKGKDDGFAAYFAAKSGTMRGTAYLLCGDWHRAEDLVQNAFIKLYRAWNRITEHEKLDAYTRQILVRTFLDETRRGFFRREQVTDEPIDREAPRLGSTEDRVVLLQLLAKVPPRQRAALVLRFWEDLSLEDTAQALRCSVGTVKSQTSRGLANLRALLPAPTATY